MKRLGFLLWILSSPILALAQWTNVYQEPGNSYQHALNLYENKKYTSAKTTFNAVLQFIGEHNLKEKEAITYQNAQFYIAAATYQLFQNDAAMLLADFIEKYPENAHLDYAKYYLGRLHFKDNQYKEAIAQLRGIDVSVLGDNYSNEYKYTLGYSYYITDDFKNAKSLFSSLKAGKSEYNAQAYYYLGLIAYEEKNYNEAITLFEKVKDHKAFGKSIPYYIASIYFLQKKYDQLLTYAVPYATQNGIKNIDDINNLIGQTYFVQENFASAIPYLKRWVDNGGNKIRPIDYYQLGYSAYKTKDYKYAAELLQRFNNDNDSLSQSAMYLLGDSYLKLKQKDEARNAFYKAAKANFDRQIKEISSFNYAKLTFETGLNNQSIDVLQAFITAYPKSKFSDEAKSLLSYQLLNAKNYKEALEILLKIEDKNIETKKAIQKISYLRALECYLAGDISKANELLAQSQTYNFNRSTYAESWFWRGEIAFKANEIADARNYYQKFLALANNMDQPDVEASKFNAQYSLGYTFFTEEKYKEALYYFEEALDGLNLFSTVEKQKNTIQRTATDLYLRLADSYFAINNFSKAQDFYQKVINNKTSVSDYALYQKALLQGLNGKPTEKMSSLKELLTKYPNSTYADNAYMELANMYFLDDKYDLALTELNNLIDKKPNSELIRTAYLTKGLVFYNKEDFEKALIAYKTVVEKYPKSTEARDAISGIKNIYISTNKVDNYFEYLKTVPAINVSPNSQDSISYQAAEIVANSGSDDNTIVEMSKYLKKYPDGAFVLNARFLRAEAYYNIKNNASALLDYGYIINQPRNDYSLRSTEKLAVIQFQNKNYAEAGNYFENLETLAESKNTKILALVGQMQCYCAIESNEKCKNNAYKVLNFDQTSATQKLEANLNIGKYLKITNETEKAMVEFTKVVEGKVDFLAAEAKYEIQTIFMARKDYKQVQNIALEIADKYPGNDYFIAKAFLLLADAFVEQKNFFQAKATLESIIENYQGPELKEIAEKRLIEVKQLEIGGGK